MRTLINQAVVVGAGHSIWLPQVTRSHAIEVFFVDDNTSVSAVTVCLQHSFDDIGINDSDARWYLLEELQFTADELLAKQAAFSILNAPAIRIRAELTVFTGSDGASDKLTVRHKPEGGR